MTSTLVKLVSLLLLVVQGAIASIPARVLCIPLQECSERRTLAASDTHDRRLDARSHAVARIGHHDHALAPCNTAASDDERGCHVHVQMPPKEQLPSNPKSEFNELRAVAGALVAVVILTLDVEPTFTIRVRSQPPDFSASDQVRALKTTRLLI